MVHLIKDIKSNLTIYHTAIAGGAAGAVTRAVAQPLDVLKIRFQLQLEPIQKGSKYSSILQATTSIVKEEGIFALWSGHIPAQYLSITFGILQFSTFEKLTHLFQRTDPQYYTVHKHWINFVNGAVAAAVATVASYPFDTVRTRLIAEQKKNKAYKGFVDASAMMIRHEGFRSLFKGIIPTLGQIAPNAGIQFAVYKFFTNSILNKVQYFQRKEINVFSTIETSLLGNLLAGSIAGSVAKTVIYPFDLVKKRLQIQGFQKHRSGFGRQMYCRGVFHCVRLTVTEEGMLALYKGYWPSMLKAVLTSALHFAAYDEIKSLLLRIQGW
ncbi:mitochondrial thiamine pyrophosphate carrier-like [Plodia interpunctella]|uniref:mitochondrial thiamine pyrophosphate carrier-like n=1 Tax=Plodia interpunctella TaxID=58824 RepID=UPI002368F063|nr:mitochondrial thiamine pyrophosphate carrier-like [Plodia interpunctella]